MQAEWYYVDGTPYCAECVECGGPAIAAEDATRGPAPSAGRCACCGATPDRDGLADYRVAFVLEGDGSWEVVDEFSAADDAAANAYAEQHYADHEWYVIDAAGRNINGGDQA